MTIGSIFRCLLCFLRAALQHPDSRIPTSEDLPRHRANTLAMERNSSKASGRCGRSCPPMLSHRLWEAFEKASAESRNTFDMGYRNERSESRVPDHYVLAPSYHACVTAFPNVCLNWTVLVLCLCLGMTAINTSSTSGHASTFLQLA